MPFTGERLTSDYGGQTQIEHLHRYLLARDWCRGKDVLDVASGEGYGTALLAQVANSATGLELAQDAVEHATVSYVAPNLRFVAGDARKLPLPDAAFDIVVSFETIEHFAEQQVFLKEIQRVLRPGGLLIVSTPDRDNYSPAETPANPYHVQEMTEAEFGTLLQAHFAHVCVLLQRPIYGSVLMPTSVGAAIPVCFERRGDLHFEGSAGLSRPQYMVAFASDQTVPALPPSVYIETSRLGLLSPPEAEARLVSARNALAASQAEQSRIAAELALAVEASRGERAQIEAYGVAARERSEELEGLKGQLARFRDLREQVQAHNAAGRRDLQDVEVLHAELAGLRGEIKGLLMANQMAETACAVMHDRVGEAIRSASRAETATSEVQAAGGNHIRALEAELNAARIRISSSEAQAQNLTLSTSWRLTAPLRAISRVLLRRP